MLTVDHTRARRSFPPGGAVADDDGVHTVESITGRTSALTVISPIAPGWTPFTRAALQVAPHTPWGSSEDLQRLAFIQSARWSIISGLPGVAAHPLRYDYLLFESNFNGTLEAYLEAFADILGTRIRAIWNSSLGFPNHDADARLPRLARLRRPIPARAFVSYVVSASLPADHFYSAYPRASCTEVLAGLQADALLIELRGAALADRPASEFATRFAAAMVQLQARPPLADQPAGAMGELRGAHHAYTGLMPIADGQVDRLRHLLRSLPVGRRSPFGHVEAVHFGRWVVIDSPAPQPGQLRDGWPHAYLLTSTTCDVTDAPLREVFRGLGPVREEIYSACLGYPLRAGEEAFADYLRAHQLPTSRFYTGYPTHSVAAVRSGLHTQQRLLDFARQSTGLGPAGLRDRFVREFVR